MIKAIVFDLDGTIVNTIEDIRAALNHVYEMVGASQIDSETCKRVVGSGLRKALKDGLMLQNRRYGEDELEIMYSELIDYYRKNPVRYSTIYPGVMELINKAKERGLKLAVLSNKEDQTVQAIIDELFSNKVFSYAQGLCDNINAKPALDGLEKVKEKLEVELSEIAYLGDSEVDYFTLQEAKIMKGGLVSWGFRSKEQLENIGANPIFDTIEEVEDFLWK